jgi:NAD(P)-dependent dehydrogenase (short-subunit alcohol dehydrogenase family)
MASVFVTGSSAGIGREAVAMLAQGGHRVVAHARDKARAAEMGEVLGAAAAVVVGDLGTLQETKALAEAAQEHGPYEAVIHNAGVGGSGPRQVTPDGLDLVFQVNVLAPYVLTALMDRPGRLVYLSSGLHRGGHANFDDLEYQRRRWSGMQAYSGSKLADVLLAFAVARRWPGTLSNAVDPGWVKTRMGGPGAPSSLAEGADTPVWLATSDETAALVTGRYFRARREEAPAAAARDQALQDRLLEVCQSLSGVALPG